MFKTIALSVIIATAATVATAEPEIKYDLSLLPADVAARVWYLAQFGDRYEAAIEGTIAQWSKPSNVAREHELDLSILTPGVAARVVELQKNGDRFDAAIRAIFIEAMKPSYGFDNDDTVEAIASAAQES